MKKRRLLLISDFVIHSGFARVAEALAAELTALGWDIAVVALNYKGSYHPLQRAYRLYPAHLSGDLLGVGGLEDILAIERPDAVLIINDPWCAVEYADSLRRGPPVVVYTPIDATKIRKVDATGLNAYSHVVAYTHFGLAALRTGGMTAPASVIPHGIDRGVFFPLPQADARRRVGLPNDLYIVLILDRNQPRKRLDIAFDAFARFAEDKPDTVKLFYHGALSGDMGWDVLAMAEDLGILERLLFVQGLTPLAGIEAHDLRYTYSAADVKLSTTSGEGWGLTTMEAMACGLPSIVPDFSALGEWARGAVRYVEAAIPVRHALINTVGAVPTADDTADALNELYYHAWLRSELVEQGLQLIDQDCYSWPIIAEQFDRVLRGASIADAPVMIEGALV